MNIENTIKIAIDNISSEYEKYKNMMAEFKLLFGRAREIRDQTNEIKEKSDENNIKMDNLTDKKNANRDYAEENRLLIVDLENRLNENEDAISNNQNRYNEHLRRISDIDRRILAYNDASEEFLYPAIVETEGENLTSGVGVLFTLRFDREINMKLRPIKLIGEGLLGYSLSENSVGVRVKLTYYRETTSNVVAEEDISAWSWQGPHYDFGTAKISKVLDFYGTGKVRTIIVKYEVVNSRFATLIKSDDFKLKAIK